MHMHTDMHGLHAQQQRLWQRRRVLLLLLPDHQLGQNACSTLPQCVLCLNSCRNLGNACMQWLQLHECVCVCVPSMHAYNGRGMAVL